MSVERNPYRVSEHAVRTHRFTLFQDYNHKSEANFVYMYSKENIDALARGGAKHICNEMNTANQHYIDDLAHGRITKAEFVEGMMHDDLQIQAPTERRKSLSAMADGIVYAKEKGIEVHAVDKAGPLAKIDSAVKLDKSIHFLKHLTDSGKDADVTIATLQEAATRGGFKDSARALDKLGLPLDTKINSKEFKEKFESAYYKERINGDNELAQRIIDVTHGEKAAIMYGSAHGNTYDGKNGRDLDEYLGGVEKIGLAPHNRDLKFAERVLPQTEKPENMIYTDSNFFRDNQPKVGYTHYQEGLAPAPAADKKPDGKHVQPVLGENNYNAITPDLLKQLEGNKDLALGGKVAASHDVSKELENANKQAAALAAGVASKVRELS